MSCEISYSPLAQSDLDEIWDYLAYEVGNVRAAKDVVWSIMNRISLLGAFPESGTPLSSVCPLETEYRFVVAKGYLAFYRVVRNEVRVDRVLSGRRDYLKLLFEGLSAREEGL